MAWNLHRTTDLPELDAITKPWARADKASAELLGQVRMHVFRGAEALLMFDSDNTPIHVHVGAMAKRARGAWGMYYTMHVTYTPPDYRGHGVAGFALEWQFSRHKPDRYRSLAGTAEGILFQVGMGVELWGATEKGELLVDSPVGDGSRFPKAVPYHARALPGWRELAAEDGEDMKGVRPMTLTEIKTFYRHRYGKAWPRRKAK